MLFLLHIVSALLIGFDNDNSIIDEYLNKIFSEFDNVEYKVLGGESEFSRLEIDHTKQFKRNGKYGYLPVIFSTNTGAEKHSIVTLELKLFKKVLIADNDINRNETLQKADLSNHQKDVAGLRNQPFNPSENLSLFRSKKFVRKGSILLKSDLELMPVIFSGDKISAHSIAGKVDITIIAFAREEGRTDDLIRVRSSDNKLFTAKVIDKNNVLIIE